MIQEQKDLLLKDLSSRLPYDVKCKIEMWIGCDVCTIYNINSIGYIEIVEDSDTNGVSIERIKPYLFPLSSMTEEQEEEYNKLNCYELGCFPHTEEALDYLIKNHFDYRYLIDKGLAIDATNKNIY
jgi:hypothetical protein